MHSASIIREKMWSLLGPKVHELIVPWATGILLFGNSWEVGGRMNWNPALYLLFPNFITYISGFISCSVPFRGPG